MIRVFSRHPPGLSTLFFTEMWERFSYYGMRALLVLFMLASPAEGGMGLDLSSAAIVYGNYTMSVYLLAVPGGLVADRFLGARRAVLIGGIVVALGHFVLMLGSHHAFYLGLICIAVGTGLLKPNVTAMVGSLYSDGDPRRDAGYSIYYMGINLGAYVAPIVTGFIAQSGLFKAWLVSAGFEPTRSWHWAFGAAGVGMTLGLLQFTARLDRFGHIGSAPTVDRVARGRLLSEDFQAGRLAAIGVFVVAALLFWAVAEQAGSTIAIFGDRLTRTEMFGMAFPSAWFQSLNAFFVILLAPLFAWIWMRLGERQPSTPVKFVVGLACMAASLALMVPASELAAEGKVSPLWIVGLFFLQTLGELCIGPVGQSVVTRLAPARSIGMMMGVWLLSLALANKVAGVLAGGVEWSDAAARTAFFQQQAWFIGGCALVLLLIVPWVKRLMGGVK